MTWRYSQSSGALSHDGEVVAHGYSGRGAAKNVPAAQGQKRMGPIPRGRWTIGAPYDSAKVGPYALRLTPDAGTDTLGRGDFRIHGDSAKAPGTASEGCIIMPRGVRTAIWASGDRALEVVA